jgi:hypothetical protein
LADGNYHTRDGKVFDFQGNEVDTLEYDYLNLPGEADEHYHLVNGQLQDRDGREIKHLAQQNLQMNDVFDETFDYE